MKTKVLDYQIIVSKDEYPGGGGAGFTAYCPTLGVADDGDTIDQALANVREAIELYIESLAQDGLPVPIDQPEMLITSLQIPITPPSNHSIMFT